MSAPPPNPARAEPRHEAPDEVHALLREAGWIRTLARRLARDQASADDVAQGTLALALERRPAVRGSLRPWLTRVAHRLARRQRRGDARRRSREALAATQRGATGPASDELLERLESQQRLAREVRRLPEPYRRVLLERYYEGRSPNEIALSSGTTPATVRSQLARGLERLRHQLGREHGLHGALPFLLLAAGSERSLLPRLGAEIVAMKSSKTLAASAVLASAALIYTGVQTGLFDREPEAASGAIAQGPAPFEEPVEPAPEVEDLEAAPQRLEADVAVDPAWKATAASVQAAEEPSLTRLTGRIVDHEGVALAGARFASIYSDGRPRGEGNVVETDAEGRFLLALADDHVRHLRTEVFPMVFAASMKGRATNFVVSTPRWHAETDLGEVALEPGGALTGMVVETWGEAVPGAVVYAGDPVLTKDVDGLRISGPDTTIVRPRADTDESGRFVLDGLAPGKTRLWAHAEGRLWTISEPFEVFVGRSHSCGAIELEEVPDEQRISGLVLRPDGSPAGGAEIAFESQALMQEGSLSADSQGRFVLVPKGDGLLQVIARDAEGRHGPSLVTDVRIGMKVELQLTELRTVEVLVQDSDGEPLESAAVMPFITSESQWMDGMAVLPGQDWIRTDAEGHASVPVPAQDFLISSSMRGYEGLRLGPFEPANAPEELVFELVSEPKIEGRVLRYGEPVEGMRVMVAQRIPDFVPLEAGFPIRFFGSRYGSVESEADGSFACPVDPEWSEITVLATKEGYATGEVELSVEPGKGADGVAIEITDGGVLTGVLVPPPGQSPRSYVVAASRGDGFPEWTHPDENGRYRLEKLTPGPWRVEGRDREPVRDVLSVANRPEDKEFNWNVDVIDGEEVVFDVDMRGLGDIELSGQFLIDGEPAAGWTAELVLPLEASRREAVPAVELDSGGNFTMTARAGRYDLRLSGTIEGKVKIEALREIRLEGTQQRWDGNLTTGPLSESVEGDHDEARLVRGHYYEGDREITLLPIEGGRCEGRVPTGSSSFQISDGMSNFGELWRSLRMVEVQ